MFDKPPLANWNGVEMPLDQVTVSVLDRAFLFGDAIYEALRVYRRQIWLERRHLERLQRSLAEVRIACDVDRLTQRMRTTLAHSGVEEGLIYIQVTRGVAPRTHAFPKTPVTPNELIYVADLGGDPYLDVRATGISVITYPDLRWKRCDIKSVNLLGNCLGAQAAAEAGCKEALLVDAQERLTEGTHTTLFGVHHGCILTAPNSPHILPGVTRGYVLELAASLSVPVEERFITRDEVATIDELFLTGTTTEVLSITSVDGRPIGRGKPGPVALKLQGAFTDAVGRWLAQGGM